jgi:hypothetical protein
MKIDYENKRITMRQSWVDTFGRCPEQARASVVFPEDDGEGDAAMAGTSAHAGIEQFLMGNIEWGEMVAHARSVAAEAAAHGVEQKDGRVERVQYKSFEGPDEMVHWAGHCVQSWQEQIYPWMQAEGITEGQAEARFEYDAFVHRGWTIAHQGQVDWVPHKKNLLVDWKTSKSKYRQGDKQRWAVQPSAYASAAVNGEFGREFELPLKFVYGVMVRLKTKQSAQLVEVERHQGHIDWYNSRCRSAADLFIDVGLDRPWTTIDSGNYLCSPKWCPNYSKCRGKYISVEQDQYGWVPK